MASGFFRGTNVEQDSRFTDKLKKRLETSAFSSRIIEPVDMNLIEIDPISNWIEGKVTELLGFEDQVVSGFVTAQLEEKRHPDGRELQVNLEGFLDSKTEQFMEDLWSVLQDAEGNASRGGDGKSIVAKGVPTSVLEEKKRQAEKVGHEADLRWKIQQMREERGSKELRGQRGEDSYGRRGRGRPNQDKGAGRRADSNSRRNSGPSRLGGGNYHDAGEKKNYRALRDPRNRSPEGQRYRNQQHLESPQRSLNCNEKDRNRNRSPSSRGSWEEKEPRRRRALSLSSEESYEKRRKRRRRSSSSDRSRRSLDPVDHHDADRDTDPPELHCEKIQQELDDISKERVSKLQALEALEKGAGEDK